MRLWIAALLLLVFASQALPFAAIGKTVSKMQQSGSDDDSGDDDCGGGVPDACKLKKDVALPGQDFLHYDAEASMGVTVLAKRQLLLHRADHLPVLYPGDVPTPPPNFC